MRLKFLVFSFMFLFIAGSMLGISISGISMADEQLNGVRRRLVAKEALPNVPGHNLTAVTVQFNPGTIAPAHNHEAFVFVHVLEGRVRSQLGNAKPVEYTVGESWVEPPGVIHTLTQNLSKIEPAKLLAIFIGEDAAKLTTSGEINQ